MSAEQLAVVWGVAHFIFGVFAGLGAVVVIAELRKMWRER